MTRRRFLKGAGLAGILAGGAAPAIVRAQEHLRWRLASSFPKSLDNLYGTGDVFARNVAAATGGKFVISVHAAGELVPPFSTVDALQEGTVECAHTCGYYYFGKDETFAIDTAIPFGMNSRSMTAWMHRGNGMALLREFFADYNIVNFPLGNTGAQMGGWYRKEIGSLADLDGMKIRTGGFAGYVLQKFGCVPQSIAGSDVYQALERGTIDAVEWVGPSDDLKLGLHKVAPYYYYPGWWEGSGQASLYINIKQWNALPDDYKAIVRVAAADAHISMQAGYDAGNPQALKQLVAEGAKLKRFPRKIMDASYQATQEVYAELMERNANWRKIYPDYRRFLADQYKWIPLCESSFDQYMSLQKI